VAASPVRPVKNGVLVAVRLTPESKATRLTGFADQADGGRVLKASVTAAPERGKANKALLDLLAKTWRLPKTTLSVATGATGRAKQIHVAGDPAALRKSLDEGMATYG